MNYIIFIGLYHGDLEMLCSACEGTDHHDRCSHCFAAEGKYQEEEVISQVTVGLLALLCEIHVDNLHEWVPVSAGISPWKLV